MTHYNHGANSKKKRCKHGNESRWNRLGEPFEHLLSKNAKTSDNWLNRKITRNERKHRQIIEDKL